MAGTDTTSQTFKLDCIVGARPNFVKIAPIFRALSNRDSFTPSLIHTGQHYDPSMSQSFFDELDIPRPDINLGISGGSATRQTAEIMTGLETLWLKDRPDMVLVVGDVNSTVAASLTAVRLGIPLVHVEAGLRSRDREMPEEINRIITDSLSDLLLTTERTARANLEAEGVSPERIAFVGNVMIDTLFSRLPKAVPVKDGLSEDGAGNALIEKAVKEGFALVTLHRPSNVDEKERLEALLKTLASVSEKLPVIFPMHPRTRNAVERFGLASVLDHPNLFVSPPAAYLKMIGLMKDAKVVITDSGGIQEETTALGVPCLTLRFNTERPITITEGTNILIDGPLSAVQVELDKILAGEGKAGRVPENWDGYAAERIADHVEAFLRKRNEAG